jgi:hypothetical protein
MYHMLSGLFDAQMGVLSYSTCIYSLHSANVAAIYVAIYA